MLVLCLLLMLLIDYKGAAGLNKIRQTLTAGRPSVPTLPIGVRAASMTAFHDAVGYVKIVWPALVFGVLISAALRTSLSRTLLRRLFSGSSVRDQLAGTLAGAPLMLCSCCVAPIFPAVYQRTQRLAPALALTLASPSLNPAALTLSFLLFPLRIAGARVAMALILVLLGFHKPAPIEHFYEFLCRADQINHPTTHVQIGRFWAKWITSGLLTRDQSEVDSDLSTALPSTDAG